MKYYKFSCLVMSIASAVVFLVTLIYAFSGNNLFGSVLTAILLCLFGALTVVCLCISNVGGNVFYKIGFYILHGGLVLLIVGFMIYGALGTKYDVSIFRGETYYDSIRDTTGEEEKMVSLGFKFRLEGLQTEYHTDKEGNATESPKMYTAFLSVIYPGETQSQILELSVNKPLYINGYKIYLMSVSNDGQNGATLLFKRDPAEFTITFGIALTIVGSFLMCYLSDVPLRVKKGGARNE